jgi:hypothetical protein
MHIIGMLRLPTQRSFRVVYIWGKYWMEESTAARMPQKFDQDWSAVGRLRPIAIVTITMTIA